MAIELQGVARCGFLSSQMSTSADTNTVTLPRVAYAPSEFAALFGKEQTWAYRLLYAGKIAAIEGFGRAMIPASEIEKITSSAKPYKQS
jgi:hypothetical protein